MIHWQRCRSCSPLSKTTKQSQRHKRCKDFNFSVNRLSIDILVSFLPNQTSVATPVARVSLRITNTYFTYTITFTQKEMVQSQNNHSKSRAMYGFGKKQQLRKGIAMRGMILLTDGFARCVIIRSIPQRILQCSFWLAVPVVSLLPPVWTANEVKVTSARDFLFKGQLLFAHFGRRVNRTIQYSSAEMDRPETHWKAALWS